MDERIMNLHQSVTDLYDYLQSAAAQCSCKTMEEEFPRPKRHRKSLYPDRRVTVNRVLGDLICTCRDASILEMQEVQTSFRQYTQL
jgi:hypothetical protein